MSKRIKICLTAVLAAVMMSVFSFSCFADSYVTYSGNAGDFIFAPGGEESLTDLFQNFKDVMPGDVLTQQIVVKNQADKKVDVAVFLKSLGADQTSQELLEKLSLSVKVVDGKELSDGNAAEAAGLSEFVSLGKIDSGSTATLEVTLKVPNDLSNEYASSLGKLMWQFKVEEMPVEEPVTTGDITGPVLYWILFATAGAFCLVLFMLKRKNHA